MIRAGVAMVDITPPAGLPMSGFAARTEPAIGAHDPLSVRAIVINDTAIVVADVIGIHEEMSRRIRARCGLPDGNVVVAALHNHGGPVSMAGRLSIAADPVYLERLENACVEAIDLAVARARPARLSFGFGVDPGMARNRRHAEGPVDKSLPVLRIRDSDGVVIGVLTAYACHPVVLGADNRLWTADYPHFVRKRLEEAYPGALAVFMTGCAGDANTGHSAHASISLGANPERSFAAAERVGMRVAEAALEAAETPVGDHVRALNREVLLGFERRETEAPEVLAARWRGELAGAEPARKALLGYWIDWAENIAPLRPEPWLARVSLLDWGGVPIVALPGEIFARTSLDIGAVVGIVGGFVGGFVVSFSEGNPGYIPPAEEFGFGGYEIDEAHRYYGQPATFALGSAEVLAGAAIDLLSLPKDEAGVPKA